MSRWSLFSRTKKDEVTEEIKKDQSEMPEENQKIENDGTCEELEEDKSLASYSETLYTGVSKSKKIKTKPSTDQRIWRDVGLIEEKIDNLHITRAKKPTSELEKRVDRLVSGIDIERPETSKKTTNIIYVLSKPQAGEVKGDWAVQINGEISSHHKTKENAIKEARKIAKKKNATIMIQNVDGTFNEGFKPK